MVKFNKVGKSKYSFEGIDNYNNTPMKGFIMNTEVNYGLLSPIPWKVYFDNDPELVDDAVITRGFKTLKEAKNWLIN